MPDHRIIVATPGRFAPGITSHGATYRIRVPDQSTCDHQWIWSVKTQAMTLCLSCSADRRDFE